MGAEVLDVGKLPMEFLHELLDRYGGQHERLVVGPRVGEDAAVLDMGDRYLVAKSDPITFATDQIGWYVVHVNANDIATMGAKPQWLLLTLLLPEKHTDKALVDRIFSQARDACHSLGVVLCGGHTEVTYGLDRPIAAGLMLGEVEKHDLVCTGGAQAGDDVILTKGIAIEGTSVLAREMEEELTAQVGFEVVSRGQRLLQEPGISVVHEAQLVCAIDRPHAMHDPTEGGLATGLWEMAQASGRGIVIDAEEIRLLPETAILCRALDLDPLGLMASGALLVTATPEASRQMVAALLRAGIQAAVIGQVVDGAGVQVRKGQDLVPLPTFPRDELARLFEDPVQDGEGFDFSRDLC